MTRSYIPTDFETQHSKLWRLINSVSNKSLFKTLGWIALCWAILIAFALTSAVN